MSFINFLIYISTQIQTVSRTYWLKFWSDYQSCSLFFHLLTEALSAGQFCISYAISRLILCLKYWCTKKHLCNLIIPQFTHKLKYLFVQGSISSSFREVMVVLHNKNIKEKAQMVSNTYNRVIIREYQFEICLKTQDFYGTRNTNI